MNTLKKVTPLCLIVVALSSFAFSPQARAACDSPDPGCAGGNLAEGFLALSALAGGTYDTGIGAYSLLSNTTGSLNTGVGAGTLFSNVDAIEGTAVGAGALFSSNAANNTGIGAFALFSATTGGNNTAVGASAGINQDTGTNNIYIGDRGVAGESNVIAIGNLPSSGTAYTQFFVGGVFGGEVDGNTAVPVLIDANNRLGTVPVAAAAARQSARHQAMLNKSRHSKFEELQATVAQQQKEIALLTAQLKEQAAQIQKVSAQLELSKPALQTVLNNH
jgi:hypothetical protein